MHSRTASRLAASIVSLTATVVGLTALICLAPSAARSDDPPLTPQAYLPLVSNARPSPTPTGVWLDYQVSIPDPSTPEVTIVGTVNGWTSSSLTLARPYAWVRTPPPIQSLAVTRGGGAPLSYSYVEIGPAGQEGHQHWVVADTTNVPTIQFSYSISLLASEYWGFAPDQYAIIESQLVFLQPLIPELTALTMNFHLPTDWAPVTRLTAQGSRYAMVPNDIVNYGNPKEPYRLWGPMGLGRFEVMTDTAGGVEFIVAIPADNQALAASIASSRFAVYRLATQMLWPLNRSGSDTLRYVTFFPGGTEWFHSRNHVHGDFRVISGSDDLYARQDDLAHCTFHEWFLHNDLDFPKWDVMFSEGWAVEGLMDFFGTETARLSGYWSEETANAERLSMFDAYTQTIRGTINDVPLVSLSSLSDLEARDVLWYRKGALVNYLLDYQVRKVTQGERSIWDVFRWLHENVPNSDSQRIGVNQFLLAYNTVTRHNFGPTFAAFITGTTPLPFIVNDGILYVDEAALPPAPPL